MANDATSTPQTPAVDTARKLVDSVREGLEASTQGEWIANYSLIDVYVDDKDVDKDVDIVGCFGSAAPLDKQDEQAYTDAKFIALAHNSLPAILAYVAALESQLALTERDFRPLKRDYGLLWEFVEGLSQHEYEFALDRIASIASELLAKLEEEKTK